LGLSFFTTALYAITDGTCCKTTRTLLGQADVLFVLAVIYLAFIVILIVLIVIIDVSISIMLITVVSQALGTPIAW